MHELVQLIQQWNHSQASKSESVQKLQVNLQQAWSWVIGPQPVSNHPACLHAAKHRPSRLISTSIMNNESDAQMQLHLDVSPTTNTF